MARKSFFVSKTNCFIPLTQLGDIDDLTEVINLLDSCPFAVAAFSILEDKVEELYAIALNEGWHIEETINHLATNFFDFPSLPDIPDLPSPIFNNMDEEKLNVATNNNETELNVSSLFSEEESALENFQRSNITILKINSTGWKELPRVLPFVPTSVNTLILDSVCKARIIEHLTAAISRATHAGLLTQITTIEIRGVSTYELIKIFQTNNSIKHIIVDQPSRNICKSLHSKNAKEFQNIISFTLKNSTESEKRIHSSLNNFINAINENRSHDNRVTIICENVLDKYRIKWGANPYGYENPRYSKKRKASTLVDNNLNESKAQEAKPIQENFNSSPDEGILSDLPDVTPKSYTEELLEISEWKPNQTNINTSASSGPFGEAHLSINETPAQQFLQMLAIQLSSNNYMHELNGIYNNNRNQYNLLFYKSLINIAKSYIAKNIILYAQLTNPNEYVCNEAIHKLNKTTLIEARVFMEETLQTLANEMKINYTKFLTSAYIINQIHFFPTNFSQDNLMDEIAYWDSVSASYQNNLNSQQINVSSNPSSLFNQTNSNHLPSNNASNSRQNRLY